MTEYQSGRSMDRWLVVHIALVDNSSSSKTVSRQISKRATSRPWSSNPRHGTRDIGEPLTAAPSPNWKTTEYAKLPKGQAAATQASIDAGCRGGIDSARTIQLWCLWQDLCFEDRTDFTTKDTSVMRYVVSTALSTTRTDLRYRVSNSYGLCCIRELGFAI